MAKTGRMARKFGTAIMKAVLACTLTMMPGSAWANNVQESNEDDGMDQTLLYPTRTTYLQENIDQAHAALHQPNPVETLLAWISGTDPAQMDDSGHTLYLKSTLLDAKAAGADTSLDAVYARSDWMDLIAGQYDSCLDLLDPGKDCPYYVALANAQTMNGTGHVTDHVFTAMTNEGTIVEGALFDRAVGIAYVPKDLYAQNGEEIPFGCQLQLLLPVTFEDDTACSTDISITCHDPRVSTSPSAPITSCAFDVTTAIPITNQQSAPYLSLSDIHVRLNGSADELALKEGENAHWNSGQGILELAVAPRTLLQIEIDIDAPNLFELFTQPAQATDSSSLSYVPNVIFDRLNPDTLTPGRKMEFTSSVDYWWPNTANNSWQSCVNTGPYCYSWIHDPDSLYEYIAWSQGANWSGVASEEVSNFIVDPHGNQASRHYFNYIFEFGNWQIEDQDFHSDKWPITNDDYSGYGAAAFGLQCSHVKNAVGTPLPDGDEGRLALRILEVNQQAERPYVVIGFVGPSLANQPGVGVYKFEIQLAGTIQVGKSSSIAELSEGNGSYSTDGIVYDVFSDEQCKHLITQIRLDASGHGASARIKRGTYHVRENASSLIGKGYAFDSSVHTIEVSPGKEVPLSVSDTPQSYHADLLVRKVDSVTANCTPQGDGRLSQAEFEVRHYQERFFTQAEAGSFTPTRTWRFLTDDAGCISFDRAHFAGGDGLYTNSTDEICLPLGTLTIRETKAPEGYRLDNDIHVVGLPSAGLQEIILFTQEQTVPEDIERGDVLIEKRDAESTLQSSLGAADLDGTVFEIRNASANPVCVGGVMYEPGDAVATITVQDGIARTEGKLLPYGTYTIQEVSAGQGYLASDTKVRTFSIRSDECIVSLGQEDAAFDQVKRGDLDLRKVLETDQSRLARIPFLLSSQTTGEEHVVVTDENGIVDTSATWNPHTHNTNGNDHVLDALQESSEETKDLNEPDQEESLTDPTVIHGDDLDLEAGIWFGKTTDGGATQPDDGLGALPYDTYTLTELRSDTNEGLDLVQVENIKVTAHGLSIPLGDLEDRVTPPPAITTYACASDAHAKHLHPTEAAGIIDRVDYCNLIPGHPYQINGTLMDANTGDPLKDTEDVPITTSCMLTPTSPSGSCEISFTLDTISLQGVRIVCFEEVVDQHSGTVICSHEELSDSAQSVSVIEPRINTYASDAETGTKEVIQDVNAKIVDSVNYQGLEEGAEYTLIGTLMRKSSTAEGMHAEPVLDEQGEPIVSTIAFAPETSTGRTSVAFETDTSALADGTELVVYETLMKDGHALVVHENPANDAQTVSVRAPSIRTHAFASDSGTSQISPTAHSSITDEVIYADLEQGNSYTVFGMLMNVTDNPDGTLAVTPLLDQNDNEISANTVFIPSEPSGSVFVPFELDATECEGKRIVVFERLVYEGRVIAAHEDASSEEQTVRVMTSEKSEGSTRPASKLPQTGDGTHVILPITITLGAACVMSFALLRMRKRPLPTRDR